MSHTKTITNVPLDSIDSFISIPDIPVDLLRNPSDGDSFIGTASHSHGLGWIESVVKTLQSIDSHGQDPSRRAGRYAITLPSSNILLPASRSFKRKPGVGWCCDLTTDSVVCTVSDDIGNSGTASDEATQLCQVKRTLLLEPGIAGCLVDETPTRSPHESPKQSPSESLGTRVRTCV